MIVASPLRNRTLTINIALFYVLEETAGAAAYDQMDHLPREPVLRNPDTKETDMNIGVQ
jgi:hypothetical protein